MCGAWPGVWSLSVASADGRGRFFSLSFSCGWHIPPDASCPAADSLVAVSPARLSPADVLLTSCCALVVCQTSDQVRISCSCLFRCGPTV